VIGDGHGRRNGDGRTDSDGRQLEELTAVDARPSKPIRKDERVVGDRGLYVEIWLPERRSRRRPLYLLHGELGGSWLWQRFLAYFAPRGWEGHALNLRGHYWSETADFAELDFDSYVADARAGMTHLARPPVVIGHGLGGLLALKLAEQVPVAGLVLISPALPAPLLPPPPPHVVRLLPRQYRRELLGWDGPAAAIQRQNPDLTEADVMRVQHMMGVESGAARRQMLEGVSVDQLAVPSVPRLVIGGGLDRQFPATDSERLAEWLGADYQPFAAHSHYGLVIGESGAEQVADSVRTFLESHRL
jgi:pimeloyl-ACP methyl ester carboxylesterase